MYRRNSGVTVLAFAVIEGMTGLQTTEQVTARLGLPRAQQARDATAYSGPTDSAATP